MRSATSQSVNLSASLCFGILLVRGEIYENPCELKPVDTIGNCQRLVFSLAVSQHMHKITNL